MPAEAFREVFDALDDPRGERGRIYPLADVLLLATYGTLCGFADFTNMAYFLKRREAELAAELGLAAGVPSHDVFSDVFRLLDPDAFAGLFVEWARSLAGGADHLAIDGKAVRAAARKSSGGRAPYVISALACGCGLSVGQLEVGDKTNEITEIPRLLDLIDIEGCTVTVDAIGTQVAIMEKVVEGGGHFCLQLKANQPTAFESAGTYFRDLLSRTASGRRHAGVDTFRDVTKGHGRLETRTYATVSDESDVRAVVPASWRHVRCLGMASHERTVGGETSREVHFHVMDRSMPAEEYARYARGHWAIENTLHWVLDVHFGEDRSTAREGNAVSNLALLRKSAFNLSKLHPDEAGKTSGKRQIDFTLDVGLFRELVFEAIPEEWVAGAR